MQLLRDLTVTPCPHRRHDLTVNLTDHSHTDSIDLHWNLSAMDTSSWPKAPALERSRSQGRSRRRRCKAEGRSSLYAGEHEGTLRRSGRATRTRLPPCAPRTLDSEVGPRTRRSDSDSEVGPRTRRSDSDSESELGRRSRRAQGDRRPPLRSGALTL